MDDECSLDRLPDKKISAHFHRLHSLLQRIEAELLVKQRLQEDAYHRTVRCISGQLRRAEEQLNTALLLTAIASHNLERVDIAEVTERLRELHAIPCNLVQDPSWSEKLLEFQTDNEIRNNLEKHCQLKTPPTDQLIQLLPTKALPEEHRFPPPGEPPAVPELPKKKVSVQQALNLKPGPTRKENERKSFVEGSSEVVRVTHVKDPSCFYVQQVCYTSTIKELQDELKPADGEPALDAGDIVCNRLYVVKSQEKWLRCRVLTVNEDTCDVLHIDYGSEETVTFSSLRKIHPKFTYMPPMSLQCALFDIAPSDENWSPEATEHFKKLLSDETVPVSMHTLTISGNTYLVDLCLVPRRTLQLISLRESMVLVGYATYVSTQRLLRTNPASTYTFFVEEMTMERYTKVRVTHVASPEAIYVQKLEGTQQHLQQLETELGNHYRENPSTSEIIHGIEQGLPCAAKGSNGRWCRCIVSELTDDNEMVTLYFIDYGYRTTINCDQIRALPKRFLSSRAQGIRLSLRHSEPLPGSTWTPKVAAYIWQCLRRETDIRAIPFERTENVYSSCIYFRGNKNLAIVLGKAGLAQYTRSRSYKQPAGDSEQEKGEQGKNKKNLAGEKGRRKKSQRIFPPSEVSDLGNKERAYDSSPKIRSQDLVDPFKICVVIHQVESPDCIYVGNANCEASSAEFLEQMKRFYENFRAAESRDWLPNSACAVYWSSEYHRGRIIDVSGPDSFLVQLVDLGREEIIHKDDMQPLHPRFASASSFVFRIKLAGVLPCGGGSTWPSVSCEELRSIIEETGNCKFFISKIENSEDDVIPVELWIKQSKIDGPLEPTRIETNSVNKMLVERGHALPVKGYMQKRDKILAVELKHQLKKRFRVALEYERSVTWATKGSNCLQDASHLHSDLSELKSDSEASWDTDEDEQEERITDWKPAEEIPEDRFVAVPTYFDEDAVLYLHPKSNSPILEHIEEELQERYGSTSRWDVLWTPGQPCIAQYHGNAKWYRARILEVVRSDLIKVEFVDYGNVEECTPQMLRKRLIFQDVPVQCTKCVVFNLQPKSGKWLLNDLDLIHRLVVDSECLVTVRERTGDRLLISVGLYHGKNHRQGDLLDCLTKDYAIKLISPFKESPPSLKSEDAHSTESSNVMVDGDAEYSDSTPEEDAVAVSHTPENADGELEKALGEIGNIAWSSASSLGSRDFSVSDGYKPVKIPKDLDYIEIELSCNLTATKFQAHLLENEHSPELNSYYKQYKTIMEDIQKDVLVQPLLSDFAPGTPCCAQFTDQVWYRSILADYKSVIGTDEAEIKLVYVDFGNTESRTINVKQDCELYTLQAEWLALPMMSLRCELHELQLSPSIKNKNVLQHLADLYETRLVARIRDRFGTTLSVDLYPDVSAEESVNAQLIKSGVFKAKEPKQKND